MARERPHWNPGTGITGGHSHSIHSVAAAATLLDRQRPRLPELHPRRHLEDSSQHLNSDKHNNQCTAPPQPTTNTGWTPQQPASFSSSSAVSKQQSNPKDLVQAVEQTWAKQPPDFLTTKSIVELLGTLDNSSVFALVDSHSYFETKFHPFLRQALQSGGYDVVKRAVRKMRFFLHPDRLPKDLNEPQALLCRTLWDVILEAWDLYDSKNKASE